jgi:transcriptional regulator with XRE-family HTH domain
MSKPVGQSIKERRKALHIQQHDLAELAGISINTLYQIERGVANPTLSVLHKIADTLGMEIQMQVKTAHS